MHSSSSGQRGKYTPNCCSNSSSSCGKHLDPYLRQTTAQFSSHLPHHHPPPPSLSLPPSPTAVPFEMASNNSCLQQPPFNSIRTAETSSFHSGTPRAVVYVYELPYNVRKAICDLLDADNTWRELGGRYMGFNDTQLTLLSHALYRNASPTNELLTKWESSNAKVTHLYHFLAAMKHRRAMFHLLPYVDDKMRILYDDFGQEAAVPFNSAEARALHEAAQRGSGMPLDIANTSFKAPSFKHPFVNSQLHQDNSRQFFHDNLNLNFKPKSNSQSDSEHTLVDRDNEKKSNNNFESDSDRVSKQKNLDYLVKVEDFEIPYKELALATDDFSKDNILGSGGFGTVYVGEWKGTKVAVKRLKAHDNSAQALTELRVLNCCRIDNILPLYGVALDGPEPCLVYQYMSNGSLEDRLLCKNSTPPLSWIQRAIIGEGVARALNFLHTLKGNPYVHGDVKSANILLSATFEPKLGDFGLARKVEKRGRNDDSLYTHCTVSSVNGTSVYLPSEYLRNKVLSAAVDVYSYGIVILEMATGRRAYDGKRLLINSVEDECSRALLDSQRSTAAGEATGNGQSKTAIQESLMDRRIRHLTEEKHWFYCLLELGRKCAHKYKSKRPFMIQILEYFNQCKTTDRIHKLCDKRSSISNNEKHPPVVHSRASLSKSNIKSPLELQLWYDFVRKSCGTLSDAVFENFGAQVTKLIEECRFSLSNESNLHLDRLLNSLHGGSSSAVKEVIPEEPKQSSPVQAATAAIPLSNVPNSTNFNSNVSNDSSEYQNESLNFPQMLQFMTMSSNNSEVNSESTIEDELSSQENSGTDLTAATNGPEQESADGNDAEMPLIPLLTALGFQNDDITEIINNSSTNLSDNDVVQE